MAELNKRTAATWRSFLASDEGQRGLGWIDEQRPPLDEKNWQQAAGFEQYRKRITEILEFGLASKNDDEGDDKLKI